MLAGCMLFEVPAPFRLVETFWAIVHSEGSLLMGFTHVAFQRTSIAKYFIAYLTGEDFAGRNVRFSTFIICHFGRIWNAMTSQLAGHGYKPWGFFSVDVCWL